MRHFAQLVAVLSVVCSGMLQAQETTQQQALESPSLDRFDIAINAENEADQATIVTLASTFVMMATQTAGLRKSSRLDFRSGTDLIAQGVATEKLRRLLPDQLALSVARLDSMVAPCDISRHRFDDVDVLVAVHSLENAQPQDAHRCFVAALWIYHAGGTQGVNVDRWRVPYASLIGSVAGGRPAFAGFETEDN